MTFGANGGFKTFLSLQSFSGGAGNQLVYSSPVGRWCIFYINHTDVTVDLQIRSASVDHLCARFDTSFNYSNWTTFGMGRLAIGTVSPMFTSTGVLTTYQGGGAIFLGGGEQLIAGFLSSGTLRYSVLEY